MTPYICVAAADGGADLVPRRLRRRRDDPLHGRRRPHRPRRDHHRGRRRDAVRRVPRARRGRAVDARRHRHDPAPLGARRRCRVRPAVANGGRVAGEPKHEAYGARSFSMLDPFGHRWMVQTPEGAPTIEEVAAASPGFTITTAAGAVPPPIELGYYTISVPDTARAGRFYGALFGWAADAGRRRRPVRPRRQHPAAVRVHARDDRRAAGAVLPRRRHRRRRGPGGRAGRRGRRPGRPTTRARTPCAGTTRDGSSSSGSRRPATSDRAGSGAGAGCCRRRTRSSRPSPRRRRAVRAGRRRPAGWPPRCRRTPRTGCP